MKLLHPLTKTTPMLNDLAKILITEEQITEACEIINASLQAL